MDSVISVRKQERKIRRKNPSDINLNNRLLRIVRYDEVFSENKITRNRSRCHRDIRDNIVDNRETMKFEGDFITVENKTLENITK